MQSGTSDTNPFANHQDDRAIEVVGLHKGYGGVSVLDDCNLSVRRGELLVVLGNSGSGKSTLLKLISGLEKPSRGSIRIGQQDQASVAPHRRDVAVVFQNGNGYAHLSVHRNLTLSVQRSHSNQELTYWSERLKLGSLLHRRLEQLSGGEAQRVAIARAMMSGKSIVLLDEPLTHLNQSLREEIKDLILMVHRESGKTFVYVTHDSDEAFYMASRIAVLANGTIQQVGTPRSIYLTPESQEVGLLLGQPTMDMLRLPSNWFGLASGEDANMLACGVRCDRWQVTRIALGGVHEPVSPASGLTKSGSSLVLCGEISDCRWMGNHWLLDVQSSTRVRIRCEARIAEGWNELFSQAEQNSRACQRNPTSQRIGIVEATVPLSLVHTFGESRIGGSSG